MKILHISTFDYGGAGLCAYRICKAQRDLGHDANLLVLHKRHTDSFVHRYSLIWSFLLRVFSKFNIYFGDFVKVVRLMKETGKLFTLPCSIFDITEHKLIREADVIHIHWASYFLNYETFFAKYGNNKKIVLTLHDENLFLGIAHYKRDELPDNELEQKYKLIKEKCISASSNLGVVFLSKMMYEQYVDIPMLSSAKKIIINNSVDYSLYDSKDKVNSRKKYGIPLDTKLFAFCAYDIYDQRKGLDVLSKALLKINPDYRVLAIGNNQLPEGDTEYSNVISVGPSSTAEDISEKYSCADYFCMPSYQEAFAQTPIEAMACGLPIVVFPCSGTEEIVNATTGIRCEDFTEKALIEAITRIIAKNYDHKSIRQFAIDNFSPEKIANDYVLFYKIL